MSDRPADRGSLTGSAGTFDTLQPTSRVTLRPPVPSDYEYLYASATLGAASNRWRFRGRVPSFDEFIRTLWDGVAAQYVVIGRANAGPAGLAVIYNLNVTSSYAYASVLATPATDASGLSTEGLLIALSHAFKTWKLRKIYFETPECNLAQFKGLLRYSVEEGRLLDHDSIAGERWDLLTLALYREVWMEKGEKLLSRLRG